MSAKFRATYVSKPVETKSTWFADHPVATLCLIGIVGGFVVAIMLSRIIPYVL